MKKIALVMMILTFLLGACTTLQPAIPAQPTQPAPQPTQPGTAEIANPASVNCVNQGGTLKIETKPDGSQYGVCLFEDNLQCEEWAMLRGDCPVGGIKVTGYVTPAAQYCAITGGTVEDPGTPVPMCKRIDGTLCNAEANMNGECPDPNNPEPNAGNKEVK